MNKLFYLFPIVGTLIGVLTVLMNTYCLAKRLQISKKQLLNVLGVKLRSLQTQGHLDALLDEKLNTFIVDLRNQIPMGSMLLTQSLSAKVKELAKDGILKMLPDIQERVKKLLSQEIDLKAELWEILRPELIRTILYAALIGGIIGSLFILFTSTVVLPLQP